MIRDKKAVFKPIMKVFAGIVLVIGASRFLSGQPMPSPKNVEDELSARMTVDYENKTAPVLRITLTNEGDDVEMYTSRLPWSHWHSMTLLIAYPDGPVVEFIPPFDDAVAHMTILKKDTKIEGTMNLRSRYNKIEEILSRDNLDLFWSYQVKDVNGKVSKRMGGWIPLPKKEKEVKK